MCFSVDIDECLCRAVDKSNSIRAIAEVVLDSHSGGSLISLTGRVSIIFSVQSCLLMDRSNNALRVRGSRPIILIGGTGLLTLFILLRFCMIDCSWMNPDDA